MKKLLVLAACGLAAASQLHADTIIADWTFETSAPLTAGPFAPEIGLGVATGFHAGPTTAYSSPAGNGSAKSFSSTLWAVGDYYQVQVSTLGLSGIQLSYDQVSSATGPGKFQLEWSTDGINFNNIGTPYTVLVNTSPNAWSATPANHITTTTFTDDLSSITALDNQATVFIRFADANTTAANGTTTATGGTDRIDNIILAVPEPSTMALFGLGAAIAGLITFRRRK